MAEAVEREWTYPHTMVALLLAVAACSSPGSDAPVLTAKPEISSYRLGPGDRLGSRVLGADELSGQYSVQDDGKLRC